VLTGLKIPDVKFTNISFTIGQLMKLVLIFYISRTNENSACIIPIIIRTNEKGASL